MGTTRQRNARGDGEKLREQLITAATDVLDAEGDAERVSVRAIARTAGVSPTALYLHFPDRDALVAAAVDRGFTAFNEALATAGAPGGSARERIRAMGLAYVDFAARQPAVYAVLFSARRPIVPGAAVDRSAALGDLARLAAEAAGTEDEAEGAAIALALWASLHGFATLRAARSKDGWPPAEEFVARLERAYFSP